MTWQPGRPLAPRGSAYQYAGCGWGERIWCGNQVDWIWSRLAKAPLSQREPLRISYLIPHHNVTGGMKMIMKQIEHLHRRGHWVQAVFRSPDPHSSILPPWSHIEVDDQRLLSMNESVVACFRDSDVIMVGYFTQLLEFKDIVECPGPIVYWEQGHEHVFGDPAAAKDWDRVWHICMSLPIVYLSVSSVIRDILAVHYMRDAPVVPNAIDCSRFHPDPAHTNTICSAEKKTKRILLVGNPGLRLKNFQTALQALNLVYTKQPIQVTWICQVQPRINGVTFPVKFVVNPPQDELPILYRDNHDVFLFTSVYEAWGMPVLEAMASGIPVVTSRCHGVDMFCKHKDNCLMADSFDEVTLSQHILTLMDNPRLAKRIARRGRAVAETLTWDNSMEALECALYQVQHCLGHTASKITEATQSDNSHSDEEQKLHIYASQSSTFLPSFDEMRHAYHTRLQARTQFLSVLEKIHIEVSALSGLGRFETAKAAPLLSTLRNYVSQWQHNATSESDVQNLQYEWSVLVARLRQLLMHHADDIMIRCAVAPSDTPILYSTQAHDNGENIVHDSISLGNDRPDSLAQGVQLPADAPLCLAVPKAKGFTAAIGLVSQYAASVIYSDTPSAVVTSSMLTNDSTCDTTSELMRLLKQCATEYVSAARYCLLRLDVAASVEDVIAADYTTPFVSEDTTKLTNYSNTNSNVNGDMTFNEYETKVSGSNNSTTKGATSMQDTAGITKAEHTIGKDNHASSKPHNHFSNEASSPSTTTPTRNSYQSPMILDDKSPSINQSTGRQLARTPDQISMLGQHPLQTSSQLQSKDPYSTSSSYSSGSSDAAARTLNFGQTHSSMNHQQDLYHPSHLLGHVQKPHLTPVQQSQCLTQGQLTHGQPSQSLTHGQPSQSLTHGQPSQRLTHGEPSQRLTQGPQSQQTNVQQHQMSGQMPPAHTHRYYQTQPYQGTNHGTMHNHYGYTGIPHSREQLAMAYPNSNAYNTSLQYAAYSAAAGMPYSNGAYSAVTGGMPYSNGAYSAAAGGMPYSNAAYSAPTGAMPYSNGAYSAATGGMPYSNTGAIHLSNDYSAEYDRPDHANQSMSSKSHTLLNGNARAIPLRHTYSASHLNYRNPKVSEFQPHVPRAMSTQELLARADAALRNETFDSSHVA